MKDECIIIDIDGTLADVEHRVHFVRQKPKKWKDFHQNLIHDQVQGWCLKLIEAFRAQGTKVVLLTGRDDDYISESKEWLEQNQVPYDELFMRATKDRRSDHLVKKDFYLNEIKPRYKVLFVVEDRLSVVKMWRELGVVCLHCDWGDF